MQRKSPSPYPVPNALRAGERGVSLLDTVVGTALMLVVFLGITAVFQLALEVVTNNRARAGAIALANERMEYLRSLSYPQIGVIGGIPAGNVPQEEDVSYNGLTYNRRTMVLYSDDPRDGIGAADTNGITADFKTIRVEVNWRSRQGERGIVLVGRISPAGVETAVPGGTLALTVVDESATPVPNAQVDIINVGTSPAIDIRTYTDVNGNVTFIGAPAASDYQIIVAKAGYSTAQTYPATQSNPNPNPRHLTVVDGQTTSASFVIDLVATKTVETYGPATTEVWSDTFDDSTKLSLPQGVEVANGDLIVSGAPPYPSYASARSVSITPVDLWRWGSFEWSDSRPGTTSVRYRVYDSSDNALPESVLPGNSVGFATSSVDLSSLSVTTYPSLRVGVEFTNSQMQAPSVHEWSVSYVRMPRAPNLSFSMRGTKTIGNSPTIYKYDEVHSSGSTGSLTLQNVEADTYTLDIPSSSGYFLAGSCAQQPEGLAPASSQTTRLYATSSSAHALRVDVHTSTNAPVEGATVEVGGAGYARVLRTGPCGDAFFGSLVSQDYAATTTMNGYRVATSTVFVNGATKLSITLIEL